MRPIIKNSPKSKGFTLIEMAIVLLITGLIILALIGVYSNYVQQAKVERVTRALANAKAAVSAYKDAYLHYPCPAKAGLAPGSPNYGAADCTIIPVGGVLIGEFPETSAETTITPGTPPTTTVKTIDMSILLNKFDAIQTNYTDPWGNKLVYAVTANMTQLSPTFNNNTGAVSVIDEFGNNTGGIKADGHFALLSRGSDSTCPGAGSEFENCNNDQIFVDSIRYDQAGLLHYDDYIAYFVQRDSSLWSQHLGASGVPAGDAKNDNTGNIGVNTTTPTEKLDVNGDVAISGDLGSQLLCNSGNCFDPKEIFQIDMNNCLPSGSKWDYATSISISATGTVSMTCANFSALGANLCPAPFVNVRGVYSDGTAICN